MKKCYINGTGCVSAQKTVDAAFLEETIVNTTDNVLELTLPNYKDFISPVAARRMAKGVKNGIVASAKAMLEAGTPGLDAIVTGTGMGCSIDSEKFLKTLLDNKEEFLTPTSFIQSTHNTVGAQIALGLQCKAYNFTYVNGAVSFESALIDAKMQIEDEDVQAVLVGGIEESAENTLAFLQLSGSIKAKADAPYSVLGSESTGAVFSEGATFFVLGDTQQQSTYAQLTDVSIYNLLSTDEVAPKIETFLKNNNLTVDAIDAVVLGYNGDVSFDGYYNTLAQTLFANTPQVYYKHLSGEFNTASAFGLWVGANIVKLQHIPQCVKVNSLERAEYKNILLYNQYRGQDHSFTLISKC